MRPWEGPEPGGFCGEVVKKTPVVGMSAKLGGR